MVVFCVKMTSDYFKTLNGYSKVRYLDKIKVINNQDPCSLLKKDFSANIKDFPDVSYMDMVNYLVYGVSHYTSEDLKAYKSIQSYNLFKCGWVSHVYIKVFPGMHLVIGKAIFGVQLVITMVMASILQKISAHFSVARWLLSYKLTRYLHPTDEELMSLAGIQRNPDRKSKGKKGKDRKDDDSEFMVPKNLELQLDSTAVHPDDMLQLHFYTEYQWLLDFALCALVVYIITEFYYYFIPARDEVNLSILWCILVVGFAIKILLSLTALYFRGEEAIGERSMCLTAGFLFFFIAMVVLIADEELLEFGLEPAYSSFNSSAHTFLKDQGLDSSGPASKLMFKLSLAFWCGLIGCFFTFPGLRFARMHKDALRYCRERPFLKLLLHLSFISPVFAILMWVKPVSRYYFTERTWPGIPIPLMTPDVFETTRLVLLVGTVIVRFILMPHYLQCYLNMAPEKLKNLRKEAGRISNVELQKMVARVYYYLCVVTLQYLTPLMLCLFFTLMLKTLGNYTWGSYFSAHTGLEVVNATKTPATKFSSLPIGDDILESTQQLSLTLLSLKKVFTPVLYRGILGFMTWWLCAVWFSTSAIGLIYYSYCV